MDYFKILNLTSEPFSNSPDPDFFFQSAQHVSCLQKLEISLRLRRGLNIVVGDVGAGKTTLSRLLIRRFAEDDNVEIHLILDPHFKTPVEFLKTVTGILSGDPHPELNDGLKLKETIKSTLYTKGVDENRTVILIIDEGQKLPLFCLEILREFLNYETNNFKLLQIVIFAQREFEETIGKLENFRDRINFYHELGSLNLKETKGLVEYRLKQASHSEKSRSFFTSTGFLAIFLATGGFPRKIINLCHRSLLAMIIQNKSRAGFILVFTCMDKEGAKRFFSKLFLPAAALAAIIFGVAFAGIYQSGLLDITHHAIKKEVLNRNPERKVEPEPLSIPVPAIHSTGDKNVSQASPSPGESRLAEGPIPKPEKPSIRIKGIEEQEILDEADQKLMEHPRTEFSTDVKTDPVTVEPSGVRVLSGPGAGIEVRRLIPGGR